MDEYVNRWMVPSWILFSHPLSVRLWYSLLHRFQLIILSALRLQDQRTNFAKPTDFNLVVGPWIKSSAVKFLAQMSVPHNLLSFSADGPIFFSLEPIYNPKIFFKFVEFGEVLKINNGGLACFKSDALIMKC